MDPFEETPESAQPESTQPAPKKPRKVTGTRKITYAAAAAAIGTVCSVVAIWLPVHVMPLVLTAFACFIVFDRCGWAYGFVTEAAVVLMTFFVGGAALSATFVLLCVVFVPYAPLAVLLKRFRYRTVKHGLIRGAIVAAFTVAAFTAVYYVLRYAVLGGGVDLSQLSELVGGYWVVALLLIPVSVSIDFLFVEADRLIGKRI